MIQVEADGVKREWKGRKYWVSVEVPSWKSLRHVTGFHSGPRPLLKSGRLPGCSLF